MHTIFQVLLSYFTSANDLSSSVTLKEAAVGTGIYVGATLNYNDLFLSDTSTQSYLNYTSIHQANYDLMTAENKCKMREMAGDSYDDTDFNFDKCLEMADYALTNDLKFRAHNLVWAAPASSNKNPDFVDDDSDKSYSAQKKTFMESYITAAVQAIPAYSWDVVNEALAWNGERQDSAWGYANETLTYMCDAFTAARAANSTVKLFYNDDHILTCTDGYKYAPKCEGAYELITDLLDMGCPIDGVGFESHIDIASFTDSPQSGPDLDELLDGVAANVQKYADLGLDIHFTELTVSCNDSDESACTQTTPWDQDALDQQAKIYSGLLQICLDSPACKSFETWGYTDAVTNSRFASPQDALPFDLYYTPKPAYDSMIQVLQNFTSSTTSQPVLV